MGSGDDRSSNVTKLTPDPSPDLAESPGPAGWLDVLNTFLERAYLEADRNTGC